MNHGGVTDFAAGAESASNVGAPSGYLCAARRRVR